VIAAQQAIIGEAGKGKIAGSVVMERPLLADIVAKVENPTTLKISRKLIFRPLCCCVSF
jgi:hypothetical protein